MTLNVITKEDALLCASVVKEVARAQGIVKDPAAVGRLTARVAKLYNSGTRDRELMLAAATEFQEGSARPEAKIDLT